MKYDICVFGGCSIDQTFYANEYGEYNDIPDIIVPGGKGSNQAVAAARAGAKVTIITRIGNDQVGKQIEDNLRENNVDISNLDKIDNLNNDQALIYIDNKTKDNKIERITGAIDSFTEDMINTYEEVLKSSKIIIAQMKIPKNVSIKLINFCYENKIPIIITPCRPKKLAISEEGNKELIDKITYITCNEEECRTMFETDNIEECVRKYPNKLIVTLGENGVIYNNGSETIHLPAIKPDIVEDTAGAGDTFNGNFANFIIEGYSFEEAIYYAQFAASLKITKKSAQGGMPYKAELEEYIKEHDTKKIKK